MDYHTLRVRNATVFDRNRRATKFHDELIFTGQLRRQVEVINSVTRVNGHQITGACSRQQSRNRFTTYCLPVSVFISCLQCKSLLMTNYKVRDTGYVGLFGACRSRRDSENIRSWACRGWQGCALRLTLNLDLNIVLARLREQEGHACLRAIRRGGGAFDNVADCLDADTSSIGTALSVPLASNRVIAELIATCSMKVSFTLVARLTSPVGHAFAYGGSGRTPAIVIT